MLARLMPLLILFPLAEIALLVWLAGKTSALFVLGLVIGVGALGTLLARHQGFQAWRRLSGEMEQGRLPGESLLDAFLVLVAAILLILPGLISDAAALVLLFPPTRRCVKAFLRRNVRLRMVTMPPGGPGAVYPRDEILDVKVIESPRGHLPG